MHKEIQNTWDKWFKRNRLQYVLDLSSGTFEQFCDLKITSGKIEGKKYQITFRKNTAKTILTFEENETNGVLKFENEEILFCVNQSGQKKAIKGITQSELDKIAYSFLDLWMFTKLTALAMHHFNGK